MEMKALELIEQLAANMGVAVDVLWGALLLQAPISATVGITFMVVAWVASVLAVRWTFKNWEMITCKDMESPVLIGLFMLTVLTVVATLGEFTTILAGLFNPEYWALRHVMELMK